MEIAKILGLDIRNLNMFKNVVDKFTFFLGGKTNSLFNLGVKIGSYPLEIDFMFIF
jgi:hypothetical protein